MKYTYKFYNPSHIPSMNSDKLDIFMCWDRSVTLIKEKDGHGCMLKDSEYKEMIYYPDIKTGKRKFKKYVKKVWREERKKKHENYG